MKYQFYTCDVFTKKKFGGNQLAVFPKADGLDDDAMQKITQEFNFSESAFVFQAEQGYTKKLRIFTPHKEIPFAGHPNIGSAYILAQTGELGTIEIEKQINFEEKAGIVPIKIEVDQAGLFRCELEAPQKLQIGQTISVEKIAQVLSLDQNRIKIDTHQPIFATTGLPFLFVEVDSKETLAKIAINHHFAKQYKQEIGSVIYIYCASNDEFDIRCRMFQIYDFITEDAATGSANAALAGLLTHHNQNSDGTFHYKIAQGYEMKRASQLFAKVIKNNQKVEKITIAGYSVLITEDQIHL